LLPAGLPARKARAGRYGKTPARNRSRFDLID
jgi:hypothetical protein